MKNAPDRCPHCDVPTHATESSADGYCIPCVGVLFGDAELPDDEAAREASIAHPGTRCAATDDDGARRVYLAGEVVT